MVQKICILAILILFAESAHGIDPVKNGIFKVTLSNGTTGTAFVIHQKGPTVYLGTAAHVVVDAKSPTPRAVFSEYKLSNSEQSITNATIALADMEVDLAIMKAETPLVFDVIPLHPAMHLAIDGKYRPIATPFKAECWGYGFGEWQKTEGNVVHTMKNAIYCDAVVMPGQSGGPLLVGGQYAGAIRGGWLWLPKDKNKLGQNVTWPVTAGTGSRLKEMLEHLLK